MKIRFYPILRSASMIEIHFSWYVGNVKLFLSQKSKFDLVEKIKNKTKNRTHASLFQSSEDGKQYGLLIDWYFLNLFEPSSFWYLENDYTQSYVNNFNKTFYENRITIFFGNIEAYFIYMDWSLVHNFNNRNFKI